jgi:hypothetical protein
VGREPVLTAAATLGGLVAVAYLLLLALRGGKVISAVYSDGDAAYPYDIASRFG